MTNTEDTNPTTSALMSDREAMRERIAELEAALRKSETAISEFYRYRTGGELRGSYDGKPEINGLWAAMYDARACLTAAIASEVAGEPEPYMTVPICESFAAIDVNISEVDLRAFEEALFNRGLKFANAALVGATDRTGEPEPVAWVPLDGNKILWSETHPRKLSIDGMALYAAPPKPAAVPSLDDVAKLVDPYAWSSPDNMTPTEKVLFLEQKSFRREMAYNRARAVLALLTNPQVKPEFDISDTDYAAARDCAFDILSRDGYGLDRSKFDFAMQHAVGILSLRVLSYSAAAATSDAIREECAVIVENSIKRAYWSVSERLSEIAAAIRATKSKGAGGGDE